MRKKELRMVMTFHTTTEAMAAEKQFQDQERVLNYDKAKDESVAAGGGCPWSCIGT